MMTPGIYPATPMFDYHSWPAASNSRLSKLRRSPAHLKAYLEQPPEGTSALAIGRASHTAILEPDYFDQTFVVASQCDATKKGDGQRCTNSGILYRAETGWLCGVHGKGLASDESRVVLSLDDYHTCIGVRDSVYEPGTSARKMLTGPGDVELSVLWQDGVSGVTCKGRFDRHSPAIAGGVIVDIKTCRDASRREFERSIFSLGYHRQGALYLAAAAALGIPAEHFVIVAVEKEPPYAVAVYRLTEGAIAAGTEQLQPLLRRYAECLERDEWPAYPNDVIDISLPNWAWDQITEDTLAEKAS